MHKNHILNYQPNNKQIPAVIFSGGSEIVSLAVAEALVPHEIPLVIISLGKPSIIRDVQKNILYRVIEWPPHCPNNTIQQIATILDEIGAGSPLPWPAFATEDGCLRLLFEGKKTFEPYITICGARSLSFGGLDKSEFFNLLQEKGIKKGVAPSIVLTNPSEIKDALIGFGKQGVIKPALKPFSMDLSAIGAKTFAFSSLDELDYKMIQIQQAWSISVNWIAQPFLTTAPEGEASWYGIRKRNGEIVGLTAYEKWKQPRIGGSACWVETEEIPGLDYAAKEILEAIDFFGIVEMSFLKDEEGNWCLIELNPRCWLQAALPTYAKCPLIYMLYQNIVKNDSHSFSSHTQNNMSWINVERLLIAALSGEYGARLKTLVQAIKIINKKNYKAIYSTQLPKVRSKWIKRIVAKLFHNN